MKDRPETAPERYAAAFRDTWPDDTGPDGVRFVALDCETAGPDARKDPLVSIGAVAVHGGEIVLEDSFEAILKIDHNLSAVTIHGITRDQARAGRDEPEALAALLDFLEDAVIVGHHVVHDLTALNVALDRHFGIELRNRRLDTMELVLHLEKAGAFADLAPLPGFSLDALCERFDVTPHDRHTAPGDALLTALIFLKLSRLAARYGRRTLADLCEPFAAEKERE